MATIKKVDNDRSHDEVDSKSLFELARTQGFLTIAQINDNLPADIEEDQLHNIIGIIDDMGIRVYDSMPNADVIELAKAENSDTDAAEAAAAALAAVDSELGRTTDPVRMYMREMGTVELLTRKGEIAIAKRIEEGIRLVLESLSHHIKTVEEIVIAYEQLTAEEIANGRLTDIITGFVDLVAEVPEDDSVDLIEDGDEKISEDDEPVIIAEEEEEGGEGGGIFADENSGPDPQVAAERFKELRDLLEAVRKA